MLDFRHIKVGDKSSCEPSAEGKMTRQPFGKRHASDSFGHYSFGYLWKDKTSQFCQPRQPRGVSGRVPDS